MHASSLNKKPLQVLKIKSNFINVIGDGFARTIKLGKIFFYMNVFGCINYLQLLTSVTTQLTEDFRKI